MDKFNKINPKKTFLAIGIMAVLALFLTNTSALNGVLAVDNSGYGFFDCSYDNGTNKETCCDGPSDNIKCIECDVNLETGQKSNCKEVPNEREGKNGPNLGSLNDGDMVLENEPANQPQPQPQFQGKFPSSLATSK
ncbi:MAG: hypothetical protein M3Q77_09865 [Thermoproteota archaeon]|nr:hypothetical protein [Nitrosopumilus sp.]MDQ3085097.1 hypothetical protein [Thermoproteota archaeon]